MIDERKSGPLGSDELARDLDRAGHDEALSDSLARTESERADHRDADKAERGPNPIAGTMLPPD